MDTPDEVPLGRWDKMEIQKYHEDIHLHEIKSWLTARDLSPAAADDLPSIGYVAYDGGDPFAAAFLRQAEGGVGFLEALVTNPHAPAKSRSFAIDALVRNTIAIAREMGMKKILAYSINKSVLIRSEKHGFKAMPHVLINLSLENSG